MLHLRQQRNGEPVRSVNESTTLVLAGAFNPVILTPQWVARHGLELPANEPVPPVQVLAPVQVQPGVLPRFTLPGLISYVAALKGLTIFLAGEGGDPSRAVRAAAAILSKLPHTPVTGVGFNFEFVVDNPPENVFRLLTACDAMTATFPGDTEIVVRRWSNTVSWENALVTAECVLAGQQATIALNFHHSTQSAAEAEGILRMNDIFARHRERAIQAAAAISGQPLEEG